MDLAYLHLLQDLRGSLPAAVEWFFVLLSYIGNGPALVALVLGVYWCVDKRVGLRAITALALGIYSNQLVKNLACVYRPWIRDPSIIPTELAIEGAGGYSFPSGHTSGTASALGSLGWQERHRRWVVVSGAAVTALMMFARNYLGVHTPQDVLVGLVMAVASVALSQRFHAWMDLRDEGDSQGRTDAVVAVVALGIAMLMLLILSLKPYPLDYVEGVLLVDPEQMKKGYFEATGMVVGLAIGWAFERRRVAFSTAGLDRRTRFTRLGIGVALVGATYVLGGVLLKVLLPYNVAKLVQMAVVSLVAVYGVPVTFVAWERRGRDARV